MRQFGTHTHFLWRLSHRPKSAHGVISGSRVAIAGLGAEAAAPFCGLAAAAPKFGSEEAPDTVCPIGRLVIIFRGLDAGMWGKDDVES
jgi:hypothetical protein